MGYDIKPVESLEEFEEARKQWKPKPCSHILCYCYICFWFYLCFIYVPIHKLFILTSLSFSFLLNFPLFVKNCKKKQVHIAPLKVISIFVKGSFLLTSFVFFIFIDNNNDNNFIFTNTTTINSNEKVAYHQQTRDYVTINYLTNNFRKHITGKFQTSQEFNSNEVIDILMRLLH